ncbi:MAG: hypothetical protein RMA76_43645 [Deltaproteobacteria bacterium]|jgi:hypothetical protein
MERVSFLIDKNDRRIACLLNPSSVEFRRRAGVKQRASIGGDLTRPDGNDDPLLFTGGGVTELRLELLFDVGIEGSNVDSPDVRALTAPLWALTENIDIEQGRGRPPLVRFVWGKAWNVPGVIVEIAERLERFTPEGVPTRSWVTMRFVRDVPQLVEAPTPRPPANPSTEALTSSEVRIHEIQDAGDGSGERLDEIAARYYGDPSWWRVLATLNDLDDPGALEAGYQIVVPPAEEIRESES